MAFFQQRCFVLWGKRLNQKRAFNFAIWFIKAVKDAKRNKALLANAKGIEHFNALLKQ